MKNLLLRKKTCSFRKFLKGLLHLITMSKEKRGGVCGKVVQRQVIIKEAQVGE